MKEQIRLSLGQSAQDFQNIVWPLISAVPLLNGGMLKPVEAAAALESKDELDFLAGIDAWQLFTRTSVVRGIASRVQWKDCYQTFTVRVSRPNGGETEFQKRFDAIKNKDNGHLYPYITVQAFLHGKGGRLLAAAAIKTEDLIRATADVMELNIRNNNSFGLLTCREDGTKFLYIHWDYLVHRGYLLKENRLMSPS